MIVFLISKTLNTFLHSKMNLFENCSVIQKINIPNEHNFCEPCFLIVLKNNDNDEKYVVIELANEIYVINSCRDTLKSNLSNIIKSSWKIHYSENEPDNKEEKTLCNPHEKKHIKLGSTNNNLNVLNSQNNESRFISENDFIEKLIDSKIVLTNKGITFLTFRLKLNITDLLEDSSFDTKDNNNFAYIYTRFLYFYKYANVSEINFDFQSVNNEKKTNGLVEEINIE